MSNETLACASAVRTRSQNTLWAVLNVGDNPERVSETYMLLSSMIGNAEINTKPVLVTDHPEIYATISDDIQLMDVSSNMPRDDIPYYFTPYFLEYLTEVHQGPTVLLDTDMICLRPLCDLEQHLANGRALMHRMEKTIRGKRDIPELYKAIVAIDGDKAPLIDTMIWNAGVVGLPVNSQHTAAEYLQYLEKLHRPQLPECTIKEQVAASYIFQCNHTIEPCNREFLHYFSNKKVWHHVGQKITLQAILHELNLGQVWDLTREAMGRFPETLSEKRYRPEKYRLKIRKLLDLVSPYDAGL